MLRTERKVIPITRGKRNVSPTPETGAPHEEFRILTCRKTTEGVSFHLGPPLFLGRRATPPCDTGVKSLPIIEASGGS